MSLNPQQFFHPSSMISNVNNPNQPNPFFGLPPATSPNAPISPVSASSAMGYPPQAQAPTKEIKQEEGEALPSTKELVSLLNEEGGLSVVDRVVTFKVSSNNVYRNCCCSFGLWQSMFMTVVT